MTKQKASTWANPKSCPDIDNWMDSLPRK